MSTLPGFFVLGNLVAQSTPTFESTVSQVRVDTEVLSSDGFILSGLTVSDFRVFDNGVTQPIVALQEAEEGLDLVLLIDISSSMTFVTKSLIRDVSRAYNELRQGDRVAIMAFDESLVYRAPFTDNLESVAEDLHDALRIKRDGGTRIDRAVDDTAKVLLDCARTGRRRAILIITDNLSVRVKSLTSVVRHLWEADAILSGLIVPNPRARMFSPAAAFLSRGGMIPFAEKTGGDVLYLDSEGTALREMMHRIRNRYSVYFKAPQGEPGSFRTIGVELGDEAKKRYPNAHVHARSGYKVIPSVAPN